MADDDDSRKDEYRDLLLDEKDALRDLLKASEPGTGLNLHRAYSAIKASIDSRPSAT